VLEQPKRSMHHQVGSLLVRQPCAPQCTRRATPTHTPRTHAVTLA
jgi:hypothetical protein